MNDLDLWIHHGGPQPRIVRELLGAEDQAEPEASEDEERMERAILARLRASAAGGVKDNGGEGAAPQAHEAPACPVPEPVPSPAVAPPPAGLASTAMALDLSPEAWRERGKLPFVSKDQLPPQKRCALTEKIPVMRSTWGETLPLGDESLQKIVAATPFEGAGATATVYVRDVDLTTYASICAELRAWRHTVDAIRIRYGVPSVVSLQALHQHWHSRLAAHPEERAMFENLLPRYAYHAYYFPW